MKIFDIDKLLGTLTSYIETKLELFKIEIKEEISTLIAKAVVYVVLSLLAAVAIVFALMALANWLNTILESSFLGYLLVCGLIALFTVLIYTARLKIQERILRKIIDEDSSEHEDEQ